MENTKVLSQNASLCVTMGGKVYEPNKTSPTKKAMVGHTKMNGTVFGNSNGSLYSVCTSPSKKVGQVLITPPSILSQAPLQFHASMKDMRKSMRSLTAMSSNAIYLQESGKFSSDKILSTMITATADPTKNHLHHQSNHHAINTNASHKQQQQHQQQQQQQQQQQNQPIDMIRNTCDQVDGTPDGNGLVNTVKNVINFLIKPILDTKTKIIGETRAHMEPQTLTTKMSTSFEHLASSHMPSGSCNVVHILSTDMDNVPFFDCDDYIEGSEDTVDFVADSTKIPWDTLDNMSTSESIYFECNTHFKDMPNETAPLPAPASPHKLQQFIETVDAAVNEMPNVEAIAPLNKSDSMASQTTTTTNTNTSRCNTVQYVKNKVASMFSTKNSVSTCNAQNNVRRKRHRRKLAKVNSKRSDLGHKASSTTKNRNEKLRHNLEMDIYDDTHPVWSDDETADDDEVVVVDDDDVDDAVLNSDVEVIDVDEPCTAVDAIVPEVIPSGCIFKYFYRLASPLGRLQSMPAHLLARLTAIPTKSTQHQRSCSQAHLSESESDDSFITFDENCTNDILNMVPRNAQRRRQTSESSDDFIVFFDDTDDDAIDGKCSYNDDTFGDDYTDSSDESDADAEDTEEEEDSDSDADDSDDDSDMESVGDMDGLICSRNSKHKESTVPTKKTVRFNLCPKVYEMRTWKYASKEARKGLCHIYQLDRERFEKRIRETSEVLLPILNRDHRQKVFSERFQD